MKKQIEILFVLSLTLLIFCHAKCNKESSSVNITLFDKDTTTINSYIMGKWKVHYQYGGICGSCKSDRENLNEFYEFKSNNGIAYTFQNVLEFETKYAWLFYQSYPADYMHHILEYSVNPASLVPTSHFEVVKIKNDTLILAQPLIDSPDYSEFFLTRVK
jgi:hypothetical protein